MKNYGLITCLLLGGWLLSMATVGVVESKFGDMGSNAAIALAFFEIILVSIFGFFAYELAKPTVIPSFVLAIFIGMLQKDILAPIIESASILSVLTTMGAAFILFGGGLDTPFARFRKLIGPIVSIAFLGTIITAFLFSLLFSTVMSVFGIAASVGVVVVLGAALSSTDPAAIIPCLKCLMFPNPRIRDIAISESAINDVVGAVLTGVFLSLLTVYQIDPSSIGSMYAHLFSAEIGLEIIRELLIGSVVGALGFGILYLWSKWSAKTGEGGEADAALFLAIPLLCFLIATYFEGSGFLAVFVAGLLFQLEEHVSHVEHYFVHTIEGFMKPLIFMLLGASVDVHALMATAGPGIVMGLVFMFFIRPIAVFATLLPFMSGKYRMSFRELLLLSFVRETGVIPAVLLMGLHISGLPGTETVVLVGLWVILLTLIVQPPLTPLVARLLGVAKNAPAFPKRHAKGPIAVLCSRGRSFVERMNTVVEWVDIHGVQNITLLHCPEDKNTHEYVEQVQQRAETLFASIAKNRIADNKPAIHFEFLTQPGTLQENIEHLIDNDDVSIMFVGAKMLDYRLEDVKRLRVPFVFM